MARRKAPDFDEEARKLFKLLNLAPHGAASENSSRIHGYHDLDAVFKHPTSGGVVYIGNQTAASSGNILRENGITHVVNCTSDMPLYFEGKDPSISYFRFDIYRFYRELNLRSPIGVLEFFIPVFKSIDAAVAQGKGVLIHCLAGAHRAGTTGVAYTMHAANLDHRTAIAACKACRPIVDPIDNLTTLLQQLEAGRLAANSSDSSSAGRTCPEQGLTESEFRDRHLNLLVQRKELLEQECQRMTNLMSQAGAVQGSMLKAAVSEKEAIGELSVEQEKLARAIRRPSSAVEDVDLQLAQRFAEQRGLGPAGQQRLLSGLRSTDR